MKKSRESRVFNIAEETSVSSCVDYVQEKLKQAGLDKKLLIKMMLLSEECAAMLRDHSNGKGQLRWICPLPARNSFLMGKQTK